MLNRVSLQLRNLTRGNNNNLKKDPFQTKFETTCRTNNTFTTTTTTNPYKLISLHA